jgi:hypothetical protein
MGLALAVGLGAGGPWAVPQWVFATTGVAGRTLAAAGLFLLLAGPLLVTWAADHQERGMLGDAGSNASGALLGYVTAGVLGLPGLLVAAGGLLGLNLLSERVSFSAVIERTPVLRWLDMFGRSDETPRKPDER